MICEHEHRRHRCVECHGNSICEHDSRRNRCRYCDPVGHLAHSVQTTVNKHLGENKVNHSIEYLGCDILTYKLYLEAQFDDKMSFENHGSYWHIDHVIPLRFGGSPTKEDIVKRLHYTNTQPLRADLNLSKGNRYIGG